MLFAGSEMLGAARHPVFQEAHPIWGQTAKRPRLRGLRPVPREMAPAASPLLLLALLALPGLPPRAAGCPAACRCYSATVECGALRLRVVPPGIPPGTQVGTTWGRRPRDGVPATRRDVCERPGGCCCPLVKRESPSVG